MEWQCSGGGIDATAFLSSERDVKKDFLFLLSLANCHGAEPVDTIFRIVLFREVKCPHDSKLFDGNDEPSTSFRSVAMKGVNRAFAQKDHEIIIGEGRDGDQERFHKFSPSSRD